MNQKWYEVIIFTAAGMMLAAFIGWLAHKLWIKQVLKLKIKSAYFRLSQVNHLDSIKDIVRAVEGAERDIEGFQSEYFEELTLLKDLLADLKAAISPWSEGACEALLTKARCKFDQL